MYGFLFLSAEYREEGALCYFQPHPLVLLYDLCCFDTAPASHKFFLSLLEESEKTFGNVPASVPALLLSPDGIPL